MELYISPYSRSNHLYINKTLDKFLLIPIFLFKKGVASYQDPEIEHFFSFPIGLNNISSNVAPSWKSTDGNNLSSSSVAWPCKATLIVTTDMNLGGNICELMQSKHAKKMKN